MSSTSLFGRRIHIAGSVAMDVAHASPEAIRQARATIEALVVALLRRGATFVVPVDAEKTRQDGQPICFDWLVWDTLKKHLHFRPANAPMPMAIAVQHHKNEDQIPAEYDALWSDLRTSDLVQIDNVSHWNMASKRMEAQARWGDILIAVGGSEGVQYLANLYHDAGKPVIPLNDEITGADDGARRLFRMGLSSAWASRLFRTQTLSPHAWVNRLNFRKEAVAQRVDSVVSLLEALEPPTAFVVRLLNPEHEDYAEVQEFFDVVVQPVLEHDLGYKLVVINGEQSFEHPRIDQEIFSKLHRGRVVLADLTGSRPNCFLELGYALGRQLPTLVSVREGSLPPFDLHTLAAHHWKASGLVDARRRAFRAHWDAIQTRPPLVPSEPLIV